jgi:hypothetical protein
LSWINYTMHEENSEISTSDMLFEAIDMKLQRNTAVIIATTIHNTNTR